MFEQTFTDAPGAHERVLNALSWTIAVAAASAGFLGWYLFAPTAPASQVEGRMHVIQAALFGAVPFFITALMLCYVLADARRVGCGRLRWFVITLVFNCVGFFAYLVHSASKTKQWKRAAIPASYAIELMAIAALLFYPLIATSQLPNARLMSFLAAPTPPREAPPAAAPPQSSTRQVSLAELLRVPAVIPKSIERMRERPVLSSPADRGFPTPGGVPNGVPWGAPMMTLSAPAPAPPPAPAHPSSTPLRVGGTVEAARAIYTPTPIYPTLAKQARVEGIVRLEAVIGRDGLIEKLHVISGHPMLVQAALNAVKQWRYHPTLLDGAPVEVVTEIDVDFTLAGE